MFDPIKGPANPYQGPAVGLGTEAGDTWHAAVAKINAGFKRVVSAIEGGAGKIVDMVDGEARKDIADLREELAALQIKYDAMVKPASDLKPAPLPPNTDPFAPPAETVAPQPVKVADSVPDAPPPDTPAPAPSVAMPPGPFVAPPQEPQT